MVFGIPDLPRSFVWRYIEPQYKYRYFDTADNEDPHKKMWALSKKAVKLGSILAIGDILSNYKNIGFVLAASRFAYHMPPLVGTVMLGTGATCAIANIRGKNDDIKNYYLGGLPCGLIWGFKYRSVAVGYLTAILCSLLAASFKAAHMDEYKRFWEILPSEESAFRRSEPGVYGGMSKWNDVRILTKKEDPGRHRIPMNPD